MLSTPRHYAYLRIAEGCSNRCAYCIIPGLRGNYRSRRMEDILTEARALAEDGVKECIVIAQDITRYGVDLYGEQVCPSCCGSCANCTSTGSGCTISTRTT